MVTNKMLGRYLARVVSQVLRLKLYERIEFTTPDPEDGIVEVAGGGYRDFELLPGDWIITTGQGIPIAEANVHQFTFDGGREFNVGGAYIVQADGGVLAVGEFPEPFKIRRNGDTIPVRPTIRLSAIS